MKLIRLLAAAVALASIMAVASCNTLRGFGQDVEKAGEGIQKAVK